MIFKVATYNIHRCVGSDGRKDPERVAAVLAEVGARVVALQEVESLSGPYSGSNQARFLASRLGLQAVYGPTLRRRGEHYGNALLVGGEVLDVQRHELRGPPGLEPRGALEVKVRLGAPGASATTEEAEGAVVRVVATHLGLKWRERREQVRRLGEILKQSQAAGSGPGRRPGSGSGSGNDGADDGAKDSANKEAENASNPRRELLVVLGDFNAPFFWERGLWRVDWVMGRTPRRRSYPARFPLFALDRIWVQPGRALVEVGAHRSRLARVASDHLPVWATVQS